MNSNKSISILGCGWLGFELAKSLIAEGYHTKGSTTSESKIDLLQSNGIDSYLIDLDSEIADIDQRFFESEVLLINIPPGRRDPDVAINYPSRIDKAMKLAKANDIKHCILVSSTGVYSSSIASAPEWEFPIYTNQKPNAGGNSATALIASEDLLQTAFENNGSILRFGGLVGGDRKAGRFLAGKKDLKNGMAPVNMIHREDCIGIIKAILHRQSWGKTLNATADLHPPRESFYIAQADRYGFIAPTFLSDSHAEGKIVSNGLLKKEIDYTFIHPDPMTF